VRIFSFHHFHTSSVDIDGIVGSRGFCKAAKRISEDDFDVLHEVKVYLSVVVFRLDCI
jgi:hypothetical protein